MPSHVTGTARLSNGQLPDWSAKVIGKFQWVAGLQTGLHPYRCELTNGKIDVSFPDGVWPSGSSDDVFRTARHVAESLLHGYVVLQGRGVSITLEQATLEDGTTVQAAADFAPADDTLSLEAQKIVLVTGAHPRLAYAVSDFNHGLLNRENCAVLFYRAIEGTAKALLDADRHLSSSDWDKFRAKVRVARSELDLVTNLSKTHRHGTRTPFGVDEHLRIMAITRRVLIRAIASLASASGSGHP